jgi:hypothetical protein
MVSTLLSDAALLIVIIIAIPLAIVLIGAPIALLVRVLVEIAQALFQEIFRARSQIVTVPAIALGERVRFGRG